MAATPSTVAPERWVVYLSPDRRILWADLNGREESLREGSPPQADSAAGACPVGLIAHNSVLDAAFETKLPQSGTQTVSVGGQTLSYAVKAFPDTNQEGAFKGVIQVMERRGENGEACGLDQVQRINALLDLTLNGVILYDPDADRVLEVSRRVAQETGYPVREFEGMEGRLLFGDGEAALLRNIFSRMVTAGPGLVWYQALTFRDHYGASLRRFCSLRAIPARAEQDAPPVMCISVESAAAGGGYDDFSPNREFVLEAMRDGLWEYDIKKAVFHYSRNFGEIFGDEGTDLGPGRSLEDWMSAVHPDETESVFRGWRQLLKKGVRYRAQYRIRDRNGDWRWILSTIHAILNDARGRPERVLGFHLDITEAMQTERNLADAEERLRMIFENAGIGIAVGTLDGVLTKVNPAMCRLLGFDAEDIEGKRLPDFAVADDAHEMQATLESMVLRCGRPIVYERELVRSDGTHIWVNTTATLSKNELEGDRFVIVMAEDITERHRRQTRLQFEATHDVMTGAWSRYVLDERLGQHIQLALRHKQPMAYCICDLDHFKRVNDRHGHQAGDAVLVAFVALLRQTVRDTDVLGRYGGEEFGIVFPNTSVEGAAASMRRAGKLLRERVFVDATGTSFTVTATFGITGVTPASTVKTVTAMADAALYEGKGQGRDRVVVNVAAEEVVDSL